jgi:hypothetical protein
MKRRFLVVLSAVVVGVLLLPFVPVAPKVDAAGVKQANAIIDHAIHATHIDGDGCGNLGSDPKNQFASMMMLGGPINPEPCDCDPGEIELLEFRMCGAGSAAYWMERNTWIGQSYYNSGCSTGSEDCNSADCEYDCYEATPSCDCDDPWYLGYRSGICDFYSSAKRKLIHPYIEDQTFECTCVSWETWNYIKGQCKGIIIPNPMTFEDENRCIRCPDGWCEGVFPPVRQIDCCSPSVPG